MCSVLAPRNIFAAEVLFRAIPDERGTVIEARIQPQGKALNVVDGVIGFEERFANQMSVEVENGESILKLWPTPPLYDAADKTIRFSGGVPGGFTEEGLLFRVRLSSLESGDVTVAWLSGVAYQNDGKGTPEPISGRTLSVRLGEMSDTQSDAQDQKKSGMNYGILIIIIVALAGACVYGYKKICCEIK